MLQVEDLIEPPPEQSRPRASIARFFGRIARALHLSSGEGITTLDWQRIAPELARIQPFRIVSGN